MEKGRKFLSSNKRESSTPCQRQSGTQYLGSAELSQVLCSGCIDLITLHWMNLFEIVAFDNVPATILQQVCTNYHAIKIGSWQKLPHIDIDALYPGDNFDEFLD